MSNLTLEQLESHRNWLLEEKQKHLTTVGATYDGAIQTVDMLIAMMVDEPIEELQIGDNGEGTSELQG